MQEKKSMTGISVWQFTEFLAANNNQDKACLAPAKWRIKIMLHHKLYGEKAILWDLYQLVTLPTICSLTYLGEDMQNLNQMFSAL